MQPIILLAFFSGIAVMAGLFLSFYFFFMRNENGLSLRLLGLLFLAISLRIGKSIFFYISGIPDIGVAMGFMGLSSIGPLIWLYVKYSCGLPKKIHKLEYLHFAISVFGFFVVWLIGGNVPHYMYVSSTSILLVYLLISWYKHVTSEYNNIRTRNWTRLVLISVTLIWLAFVFQHYSNTIVDYATGAGFASLLIYILLIYALRNPVLFPKFSNTPVIESRVVEKLRSAVENKKIYQKPSLTLNELAQELNEPSYIISKALKMEFGKSFPEWINHYRIHEVKQVLIAANGSFKKIEGLAYEVGFNTPSAFYAAFKKETSLTPKEFQRRALSVEKREELF